MAVRCGLKATRKAFKGTQRNDDGQEHIEFILRVRLGRHLGRTEGELRLKRGTGKAARGVDRFER